MVIVKEITEIITADPRFDYDNMVPELLTLLSPQSARENSKVEPDSVSFLNGDHFQKTIELKEDFCLFTYKSGKSPSSR